MIEPDEELERHLQLLRRAPRVHHAVSLERRAVETSEVKGPLTLHQRARMLSRFWPGLDISIFGGPSYQLTSRRPYLANPLAWMSASSVTSYLTEVEQIAFTQGAEPVSNRPFMIFHFSTSPDRRSVFSMNVSAFSRAGQTGHITLTHIQSGSSVSIPVAQPLNHRIDIAFDPVAGGVTEVGMRMEAGLQVLVFFSASFMPELPEIVLDQ